MAVLACTLVEWCWTVARNFHRGLQCVPVSVSYDFEAHSGALHIEPGGTCDMNGCITMFKRIDPGVQRINILAGGEVDTTYLYSPAARQWLALPSSG